MAGTAPVGDALIDALEDVLERHPARADVPDLSYFDGALTALLLLPKGMPCAELVSNIHADIGQGFADPDDDARFIELLALRQAEIVAGLLGGGAGVHAALPRRRRW